MGVQSGTRGVSGCGQKATYIESCDTTQQRGLIGSAVAPKAPCTWVLNGDSKPTQGQ